MCEYGSTVCCGETFPEMVLTCMGGSWEMIYVDTPCIINADYPCPTSTSTTSSSTETSPTGILIVGGEALWGAEKTAEFYNPATGDVCKLSDLPEGRSGATLDGSLSCVSDNCITWNSDAGSWDTSYTLTQPRTSHISWTPSSGQGTYLLGGWASPKTSDLLRPDGVVEPAFNLRNETR